MEAREDEKQSHSELLETCRSIYTTKVTETFGGGKTLCFETSKDDSDRLGKCLSFVKSKVLWLIIVLVLMIIGLTVAFITVTTTWSASGDVNNKESEKNGGLSLSDTSTDHVTDTKNQNSAPCEDDWIWYRGKCYYFSTTYDTWSNSQRNCTSHNASLALIDNKQELEFLVRRKGNDNHWIGLRRTEDNTAWTWTNGTLYDGSLFQIRRALNETIEYVYLNHDGVESDQETALHRWICNRM